MGKLPLFAGVIVDVKAEAVNRIFHYAIPKELKPKIEVGHRVLVPFGSRKLEGYVVELTNDLDFDQSKLKQILKLLDSEPIILPSLVKLAYWMKSNYVGLLSESLQYMLPVGFRYGKERVRAKTQQIVTLLKAKPELRANATAQKRIVEVLQSQSPILTADLVKKSGASYSSVQALEKQGVVSLSTTVLERNVEWDSIEDPFLTLTEEQRRACFSIQEEMKQEKRPVLIHGVTGSGKTEIYLRTIEPIINAGKQVIVLVPEIALTSQTVNRFGARFGKRVSVLHSGLSDGERFDQWWKIFRGEVDVVIGARSAVFAPTPNLGLIILDEEHESTYKQEEGSIKYHARDVAIRRSKLADGQVILGSATPALESYHKALQGHYRLVELNERVEQRPLPEVKIVDMREQFELGNRTIFSDPLKIALQGLIHTSDQAIILLNRRGFSSFVLCRECGHVLECPNCQVSLTYHQNDRRMHCHYCFHKEVLVKHCPECASPYLRQFGVGTEQVQEILSKEFPELKSLRLDADTTRRKGAHARILNKFGAGQAQVLIGTQMVAKGLDFPDVTVVGVLSADLGLNFPDIRASERTFQLLTQVAGRSGRGHKKGNVIIQAYDPHHFAVQCARNHDYLSFYRQEISFRRSLGYPPFQHLVRILISGPQVATEQMAKAHYEYLLSKGLNKEAILGPSPAPIGRIQGRYRWQIVLKASHTLQDILHDLPSPKQDVLVGVDIDPLFML